MSRCKLLLLPIGRLKSRMSKLNRAWLIRGTARFTVQRWLALMTTAASEQSELVFGAELVAIQKTFCAGAELNGEFFS